MKTTHVPTSSSVCFCVRCTWQGPDPWLFWSAPYRTAAAVCPSLRTTDQQMSSNNSTPRSTSHHQRLMQPSLCTEMPRILSGKTRRQRHLPTPPMHSSSVLRGQCEMRTIRPNSSEHGQGTFSFMRIRPLIRTRRSVTKTLIVAITKCEAASFYCPNRMPCLALWFE